MNSIQLIHNRITLGTLELINYYQVEGTPSKADNFHVVYNLSLNKHHIPGTFSNHYLLNSEYLFITKYNLNIMEHEASLESSELFQINLKSKNSHSLSKLEFGKVIPNKIEGNLIIYSKHIKGHSLSKEYEQDYTKNC